VSPSCNLAVGCDTSLERDRGLKFTVSEAVRHRRFDTRWKKGGHAPSVAACGVTVEQRSLRGLGALDSGDETIRAQVLGEGLLDIVGGHTVVLVRGNLQAVQRFARQRQTKKPAADGAEARLA